MKKSWKRICLCCILATVLLSMPSGAEAGSQSEPQSVSKITAGAKKTAVKKGLVKEGNSYYYYVNGKKVKSAWKTIKDSKTGKKYKYYFKKDGRAVVGKSARLGGKVYLFDTKGRLVQKSKWTIVSVNDRFYYVGKTGQVATGWLLINNKLYRATSMGKFHLFTPSDGISFNSKTGAAVASTATSLKIKTMTIVDSITTDKMSKAQKLRACWNYVTHSGGFYYSTIYPNLNQSGWQKDLALRMLTYKGGNCYGFACAFAALAKEVGYSPKLVCGRVSGTRDGAADGLTRHCWVTINGAYYDPEAEWKGWMRGIYGSGSYPISHTVQKTVTF